MNRKFNRRTNTPRTGPAKLADLIADVMIHRGYSRQVAASAFQEAWELSVEHSLSSASQPGMLRRGVLEVTVKNSIILQELTFRKKQIINSLNENLNEQSVNEIRFRIGNLD